MIQIGEAGWFLPVGGMVIGGLLYLANKIPWNKFAFLDYATERIFLRRVGEGYIFIHRMLMEHFAAMSPES
jgi:hypothetical protein